MQLFSYCKVRSSGALGPEPPHLSARLFVKVERAVSNVFSFRTGVVKPLQSIWVRGSVGSFK